MQPEVNRLVEGKYCPFCDTVMMVRGWIARKKQWHGKTSFFCDTSMKCPNCYFYCVFGVPITRELFHLLHNKYGGSWNPSVGSTGSEESRRKAIKKLKALGYFPDGKQEEGQTSVEWEREHIKKLVEG